MVERKNRHILETIWALLIGAHAHHAYWADAVLTDYVTLPSSLQLSPHIFGCVAYVHLHKNQQSKLDPCVVRCVFMGCNSQQKGY